VRVLIKIRQKGANIVTEIVSRRKSEYSNIKNLAAAYDNTRSVGGRVLTVDSIINARILNNVGKKSVLNNPK
jgi:hypothetical protein